MDSELVHRYVDEQRADLAGLLATLTPEQWHTPSLCAQWSVREVAVHLVQATGPWWRFGVEAARSGFRFNAMMAAMARRDTRTPDEIVAALRAAVGQRRRPPGTVPADPLMDILVHGQDIAIPLGIVRRMPVAAAVVAAERLWGMRFPLRPQKHFAGLALIATDAPFAVGSGEPVSGAIGDIVLALAGRRPGLLALTGPDRQE